MKKAFLASTIIILLVNGFIQADTIVFQDGLNGYSGTRDTMIWRGYPDSPGSSLILYVDYPDFSSSDSIQQGCEQLLKFTSIFGSGAGQIPFGSTINSATLTLYTPSISSGDTPGNGGIFHRMLIGWDESSSWNLLGDGIQADGTDASSTISFAAGSISMSLWETGYYSFDVTSDVLIWSEGAVNEGWGSLPWIGGTDGWGITSHRWDIQTQRPKLTIDYSPPGSTTTCAKEIVIGNWEGNLDGWDNGSEFGWTAVFEGYSSIGATLGNTSLKVRNGNPNYWAMKSSPVAIGADLTNGKFRIDASFRANEWPSDAWVQLDALAIRTSTDGVNWDWRTISANDETSPGVWQLTGLLTVIDRNFPKDTLNKAWIPLNGDSDRTYIWDLSTIGITPDITQYGIIIVISVQTNQDISNAGEVYLDNARIIGIGPCPNTPPLISDINVVPSIVQSVISWVTNEPATSQIEYGLTDSYDSVTPLQTQHVTSHAVGLTGLTPNTTYHYRVKSKDIYGNEAVSVDATFSTLPDTTSPHTQIISGPADGQTICSLPIAFSWTGMDDATPPAQLLYSCQIDRQGWSTFSTETSISYSDLTDGLHTFKVKAKDLSGNEDSSPATRYFIVDALGNPPQISNAKVTVGQQQVTVSWTTDKPATSQIEYGLTDTYGSLTPLDSQLITSHTVNITGLTPQTTYYYRIKSTSGCGINSASSGASFITSADTTPPETTITSGPANGGTACENTVDICWSGSDNYTPADQLVYSYRVDSGSWSGWGTSTCHSFSLANGQHTVEVKARDGFGNEDSTPANLIFRVDTVSPSINSVNASPQAGSATINWNTNEACTSQVEYGLDNNYGLETTIISSLVTTHNVTITGLEPATVYHYRVKSTDGCGREVVSQDSMFSTLEDTTAPDTYFTSGPPDNGKACSQNVDFCGTGNDDVTPTAKLQYSFKIDSGDWSAWSFESCHSFAELSEGLHTVLVKARDEKGNIDTSPAYRNFYVDLTAPTIFNTSVSPRDYRATITWNTSEPATSQLEYGLTTAYGTTTPLNTTMDGAHTVTIRDLTPETTYHFRVRSSDGCREIISNDQTFMTTTILPANLSVVYFAVPGTTIAFGTINVSWQIQNKGPGDITTNWSDSIYLSTDEVLDDNDILIQTISQGNPLSEGSQYSRSAQLQMPLVPEGQYYIIVKADSGNTVIETDKNDNIYAQPIEFLHVNKMVVSPSEIPLNLNPAIAVSGQLDIGNLNAAALSGITATVENATGNINLQINTPTTLSSMQTGKIDYTVIASDESVIQNSPIVRFTSNEGEEATVTFDFRVIPRHPDLIVSPGYLDTGMLRGTQTLVECEISNNGAVPAYDVSIQLPAVSWMALVTPENVGMISPGEKKKIVLSLTPPPDTVLGPYTGNIAVLGSNTSLSIGFRFSAISDKVGGVRISAKDEFTYFADDHPPVSEAKVELKDVSTGQVLVSSVTDTNGICEMTQLPEAYYDLAVSAEKHGMYRETILIIGGQMKDIQAFLPRQLVTYTWNVVPVETEDRYEVHIETTFETHVPAPVVTIDPMILDVSTLTFDINDQAVVNYTVTNHGFIAVDNLTLQFGEHPDYKVVSSIEQLGRLNGMSSVVIPVIVTKQVTSNPINSQSKNLIFTSGTQSYSTSPCSFSGAVRYTFMCGNDVILGSITVMVTVNNICYTPTPPPSGPPQPPPSGGRTINIGPGLSIPSFSQQKTCSECLGNAFLHCLIGFIPLSCAGDIIVGSAQCFFDCLSTGPNMDCMVGCGRTLIGTGLKCLGKESLGKLYNIANCIYDFQSCFSIIVEPASLQMAMFSMENESNPAVIQANRLRSIADAYAEIFGDKLWLSGENSEAGKLDIWLGEFLRATDSNSENGPWISDTERLTLAGVPLPNQLTPADLQKFLNRWNRTMDYWSVGIFNAGDVPAGQDTDFIAADVLREKLTNAIGALQDNMADGFPNVMDGVNWIYESVSNKIAKGPEDGVCARVRIKIDQQVAITRTAFKATLEVENAPENVDLENVLVVLDIRDANGTASNDKFGIHTPELINISNVNGGGSILSGIIATANWLITPTRDAAIDVQTQYFVGGTLEYDQSGTHVTIPLFPAPIIVKPDPLLVLDYFLVRDVYSDDPFTPQVEPAEPFSLGLLMSNHGKGIAKNVRITSSQPQIVENEKGLLIDFKIIGTQVNNSQVSPSLTVNLGDINPGETAVAQWIMTCSLQGKFIDYNATFEHIDELGNERLSLIDSVNVHELTHVVRVDIPANDGKPDFLVNDVPDDDHLPDMLYNSDGSTAVVNLGPSPVIDGEVTPTHLGVHLTVNAPNGWVYIRANDPGQDNFRLARVIRSDGREIMVSDNAWTTHRTIRLVNQSPYRENLLHIFDKDSTGSYTLVYEEIAPDVTPPTSSVSPLPTEQASTIFTVCWSGEDNAGGSGLQNFDIYVSDNGSSWQPWLVDVTIRCASYVGQPGHTYSFYSIARDVAGNVEAPPPEPDTTTKTLVIMPPQANFVAGYLDANTQTYRFAVTYTDNQAIDVSSLNSGDIQVSGPNGFQQTAVFVDVDISDNGSPRTARYKFTAPGGTWDSADSGIYTLRMESGQVSNTNGNFVAGGILKTFAITDNFAGELVLESYNLIRQTRVGRTIFDYVFTVALYNNSPITVSGVDFELFNAPANTTIIDSNVTFAHIKPGETATSTGTLTVRVNLAATTNLYSIPWRVTFEPGVLLGDFTGDGKVDFNDLSVFATYWLTDEPSVDIAPSEGDGIINFLDFAVFAQQWLGSTDIF